MLTTRALVIPLNLLIPNNATEGCALMVQNFDKILSNNTVETCKKALGLILCLLLYIISNGENF